MGFSTNPKKYLSEILFPSGRCLGRGDWRNTNPYELGTLVDLGFAFSLLMHCFMLSFFRGCSDGNAARKEHGADIISSIFSPRSISVTSLPHKISSCEFPTWQPCFVQVLASTPPRRVGQLTIETVKTAIESIANTEFWGDCWSIRLFFHEESIPVIKLMFGGVRDRFLEPLMDKNRLCANAISIP